jgi:hypothetical protein
MRRGVKLFSVLGLAFIAMWLLAPSAQACPLCSQSIAEEDMLPQAYMYSILFMLGMPAMVFTGIGTAIFVKFRKYGVAPLERIATGETGEAEIDAEM